MNENKSGGCFTGFANRILIPGVTETFHGLLIITVVVTVVVDVME